MPPPTRSQTLRALERASASIVKATIRRNELIAQARAEGASLRTIGDAAGLSHVGVAKILARLEADTP